MQHRTLCHQINPIQIINSMSLDITYPSHMKFCAFVVSLCNISNNFYNNLLILKGYLSHNVAWLQTCLPRNKGRFSLECRDNFFRHSPQTSRPPSPLSSGYRGILPRGKKAAVAWNWQLISNQCWLKKVSFRHTTSWYGLSQNNVIFAFG